MTQAQSLRAAGWSYIVLGSAFLLLLLTGPSLTGKALTNGQAASFVIFTGVSLFLGVWSFRICRERAALSFFFFSAAFGAGPVVGVAFGGLPFALMFGVPFLFVAVAWRKAVKAAKENEERNDR